MKIFLTVVAFVTIATAFPAPSKSNETEVKALNSSETAVEANCQPGLDYCYQQIVEDLGTYRICLHQPSALPLNILSSFGSMKLVAPPCNTLT
jgi:hypothetical protein